MKILLVVLVAGSALADTPPVPKMFKGMQGQKGQYKVEVLEGPGRPDGRKSPSITICTDNLMNQRAQGSRGADPGCTYKLVKDTADEAVVESKCQERSSTITMKRESAKSMLMSIHSEGGRSPQDMKVRYTHLGACREGQGAMSFDKNSEECRKLREQAAKMDPEKQCARAKSNREECEQRTREGRDRLLAMCS